MILSSAAGRRAAGDEIRVGFRPSPSAVRTWNDVAHARNTLAGLEFDAGYKQYNIIIYINRLTV